MAPDPQISRRGLLLVTASSYVGCAARRSPASPARPPRAEVAAAARLAELERQFGGRLGIATLDTERGVSVQYRADERFPMCSTFKLPLAAAVLRRVDQGVETLGRRIIYDESALLEYAPVASQHVAEGMTIEQLCEASVVQSDNTAANLLLQSIGGPGALTDVFRSLGDTASRLDRDEPMLNTAIAGDERDTTTPRAMLGTMQAVLIGNALSAASRARLNGWLVACGTGLLRLRAGLPADYRVGDKTGTGNNGATNDLAIAWPPGKAPLLIAAYSVGSSASVEQRSELLARAARVIVHT
jgi:beta-lactamase class A